MTGVRPEIKLIVFSFVCVCVCVFWLTKKKGGGDSHPLNNEYPLSAYEWRDLCQPFLTFNGGETG